MDMDIDWGSEWSRFRFTTLLTCCVSSISSKSEVNNPYLWWLWQWDQFSSVQSLSCVRLFSTPWIAALHASLSITISRSTLKLTSIESVMPSSHLILCRPLLLLPPIPPSIRAFSNESTLHMRWPKYWSLQRDSNAQRTSTRIVCGTC